jgi:cell division protein FtsQ
VTLDRTLSRPRAARLRLPWRRLRLVLVLAVLAALLAGAWMWLRDSSLVAVRQVEIAGATSADAPRVEAALRSAAREMTTLHVRVATLRDAVAPFASVAGVRAHADFPHRLVIEVVEQRPVAALLLDGGRRVPVTGAGEVLADVPAGAGLPDVAIPGAAPPARVNDARTRAALAVAAAAPAPLLRRAARFSWGPDGLTLDMRGGPPLTFGSAGDVRAKWAAAARVLADPSAVGATYLDLRIPGRVAAGGLGPVVAESPDGDTESNPQPQGENSPTLNP